MLNFLSLLGLIMAALGLAGAFTRNVSPTFGVYMILAGLAWTALVGLPALFQTMRWGMRGKAVFATFLGLLAIATLGGAGYLYYQSPLNDLTTNTGKPPSFVHPVYLFQPVVGADFLDKNFELDRSYRQELAGIQNSHYSGFESISVTVPLVDAQPVIESALKNTFPDWRVVYSEKTYPHVEMEAENPVLRTVDDIVVEARASKKNPNQIIVDFRIRNRFPYGDLGLNARHMEDIRQALAPALTQAAAKWENFQKTYAHKAVPSDEPPASEIPKPSTLPPGNVP